MSATTPAAPFVHAIRLRSLRPELEEGSDTRTSCALRALERLPQRFLRHLLSDHYTCHVLARLRRRGGTHLVLARGGLDVVERVNASAPLGGGLL